LLLFMGVVVLASLLLLYIRSEPESPVEERTTAERGAGTEENRDSGPLPVSGETGDSPDDSFIEDQELLDAVHRGDREAVKEYVDQGLSPQEDAVALAISEGRGDILGILLEGGAPIGPWALEEALRKGDRSLVQTLLRHGAGFGDLGSDGALVLAAENGESLVKLILEEGADAGVSEDLLHRVLSLDIEDKKNITKHLAEAGADVNGLDEEGHTPLWIAILAGDTEAAKVLIDHGAEVNFRAIDITDGQVKSLVQLALDLERYETALLLVKEGAEGYSEDEISREQKVNKLKNKEK
jgi:ankyrin repeat protein